MGDVAADQDSNGCPSFWLLALELAFWTSQICFSHRLCGCTLAGMHALALIHVHPPPRLRLHTHPICSCAASA